MIWLFIVAMICAIFLIVCENLAHDCAPGRNPSHKLIVPNPQDDYLVQIKKIRQMVHDNSKYIIWRQACILALILPWPIIYFLKGRLPKWSEVLIVSLMVFIGAYASYIWLWSRYFYPNTAKMEKVLFELEEKMSIDEDAEEEIPVTKKELRKRYFRNIIRERHTQQVPKS